MAAPSAFRIRRHAKIGFAAAEEDQDFLLRCFVDSGDLATLLDTNRPERILVGRTGAGKTALLTMLKDKACHAVSINPESLSLAYLANNELLRFFESQGVNFDLFYKLLWRHIFAVELIKARYAITSRATAKKNFFEKLSSLLGSDADKQQAVSYLTEWGESIWQDTQHRVREITTKLESALNAELTAKFPMVRIACGGNKAISSEDRIQIAKIGHEVVKQIQIQKLAEVITLLAERVFNDPQNPYYLIIDRLDENWVDDSVRYRLIRALIETVREFRQIPTCKIIIALRQDLIDRVFRHAADGGFQPEKYDSLCLRLNWSDTHLTQVLDRRVNELVCRQYTGQQVSHKDLLPPHADHVDITTYMLSRTLYRPRDIIHFFNCCLEHAEGQPRLTAEQLNAAESQYSTQRLDYLGHEWTRDYPYLVDFARAFLRGRPRVFKLADIADKDIAGTCLELAVRFPKDDGPLCAAAWAVADNMYETPVFMQVLLIALYRVGLVGLKLSPSETIFWTFHNAHAVQSSIVPRPDLAISICPAFYRALETTAPR